jgi:hypothetical protein
LEASDLTASGLPIPPPDQIAARNCSSPDTIFAPPVAAALHPNDPDRAISVSVNSARAKMFAGGRLLGFNIGDWSIVAAGLALVSLLSMFF